MSIVVFNFIVYVPSNFPTPESLTVSSYSWSGRQLTADRCNKCSVIKSLDCNLSWRRNCAGCCCCAGTRGAGRRMCWCWPPLLASYNHRSQLTLSQPQSRKQASSLTMHQSSRMHEYRGKEGKGAPKERDQWIRDVGNRN